MIALVAPIGTKNPILGVLAHGLKAPVLYMPLSFSISLYILNVEKSQIILDENELEQFSNSLARKEDTKLYQILPNFTNHSDFRDWLKKKITNMITT